MADIVDASLAAMNLWCGEIENRERELQLEADAFLSEDLKVIADDIRNHLGLDFCEKILTKHLFSYCSGRNRDYAAKGLHIGGIGFNKSVELKISHFANRHHRSVEDIVVMLLNSPELAGMFFSKNPIRQGYHEGEMFSYFSKQMGRLNWCSEKLPKSGSNSIFIRDGAIIPYTPTKYSGKSIDFHAYPRIAPDTHLWVSAKYTRGNGGSQDNQYSDIRNFLKEAITSIDNKHYFMAIVAGSHYTRERVCSLREIPNKSNRVFLSLCGSEFSEILKDIYPKRIAIGP